VISKLEEYIVPEAISLGLDAASAEEVIRNLGGKLMNAGFVRESFIEAVLAREMKMPTGLPLNGYYNAAIPHTDIEHVIKSGIGIATLVKPVVFQNIISPDEKVDVRLVFILAIEQPKSLIEMLQEFAGLLQNPQLVADLMHAQHLDQVHETLKKAPSITAKV